MDQDFLLVRKMKQGDEEAMELFVRRYYPQILKYCSFHCGDTQQAEDLTQETFLRFFRALAGYAYKICALTSGKRTGRFGWKSFRKKGKRRWRRWMRG